MNIYDIAGNVSEWTLEYGSYSNIPCAYRGGDWYYAGSDYPASVRNYSDTAGTNFSGLGFRLSLYQENLDDEGDRPESEGEY